mmetsp:Transcript_64389/g.182832  ORF Transcript_64389/g.182832 Transcript_64389/m.182832 type:complete len:244 (+) Transcript_64389:3-734(+)
MIDQHLTSSPLVDVVGLDLPRKVVAARAGKRAVDGVQAVVDGHDHEGPSHKDEAGRCERRGHRHADFLDRPVEVDQVVHREHPLEVRSPEVDVERPRGVRRELRDDAAQPLRVHEGVLHRLPDHHCGRHHRADATQRARDGRNLGLICCWLCLHLVHTPPAKLIQLRQNVGRVARGQDVVPRLDGPCKTHEQATIHDLRCGHPLVDDLGALEGRVIHARACQAPVGDRAPEVRRQRASCGRQP